MKKIYIVALLVLFNSSCGKWLDVTPDNTIVETELFKEAQGFQNALNGIYREMSKNELYGKEMIYGFNEVLSQTYVIGSTGIQTYSYYTQVAKFDYAANDGIIKTIDKMWSKSYFVIANCNNLINNVQQADSSLFRLGRIEKEMIMGEALAVRAMMHLDMLRMFASAPIKNDTKPYIPYVVTFPYYGGQSPESNESIIQKIEKDLIAAADYLKDFDTKNQKFLDNIGSLYRFRLPNSPEMSSPFYNFRGYRLNYLAAKSILARLYNYAGRHKEANDIAQEIIDFATGVNSWSGKPIYALKFTTSSLTDDRKYIEDLIFGLSTNLLLTDYLLHAKSSGSEFFVLNKDIVQFEGVNEDLADNRWKYLVSKPSSTSKYYLPLKNVAVPNISSSLESTNKDLIPIIRLSELYFIQAEYYASVNDFAKAEAKINAIRTGRNSKIVNLGITDMASFKRELFIEARKELFQEGQIFFYYKKYDERLTKEMNTTSFVIPVPDSEKI